MIVTVQRITEESMTASCDKCLYWVAKEVPPNGECRESSPTTDSKGAAVWPPACAGDFCGKFQPKE